MAVDHGLFQALTGPMQASNAIQQDRDVQRVQKLELEEREYQLKAKEIDRQKALQGQLDLYAKAANDAVFSQGNFKRQKDVDDYYAWHEENSGWKDIQQILTQYGNINDVKQMIDVYTDPKDFKPDPKRKEQNYVECG